MKLFMRYLLIHTRNVIVYLIFRADKGADGAGIPHSGYRQPVQRKCDGSWNF